MKTFLGIVFFGIIVSAQGNTFKTLVWDQDGPDLDTVLTATYKHYDDGAAVGIPFASVLCVPAGSTFNCQVPIGPYVPGNHSIVLTQTIGTLESDKSVALNFQVIVAPSTPKNIRLQ